MIAVAESTPGPIGVNTATFAGFRAAGIPGAVIATFGLVLPSFLIILAKIQKTYPLPFIRQKDAVTIHQCNRLWNALFSYRSRLRSDH